LRPSATLGPELDALYRATASERSILAKDGRPDHRIVAEVS